MKIVSINEGRGHGDLLRLIAEVESIQRMVQDELEYKKAANMKYTRLVKLLTRVQRVKLILDMWRSHA